jgi:hypothetical protein
VQTGLGFLTGTGLAVGDPKARLVGTVDVAKPDPDLALTRKPTRRASAGAFWC